MARRRPVERLITEPTDGSGKAQVVESPSQLSHILWAASRGELGRRNVAMVWMLFGSGLRVNEVAQLKVLDCYYESGELKNTISIPAKYTKTNNPRAAYILVPAQREAIESWRKHRIEEGAILSDDGSYAGLKGDSPLFLSKKGGWRHFSFNEKKYKAKDDKGNEIIKSTRVCSSLENLMREMFKGAGLHYGSSHSGRRTLATWLDRKGFALEIIQRILGHENPEMTLEYIDPDYERIKTAFAKTFKNIKAQVESEK